MPRRSRYARYYIEAYYADGSRILGNLDGQAAMMCQHYSRTHAYQNIKSKDRSRYPRVHHWCIVGSEGELLEKIDNPYHNAGDK
jgi:hypothetical protein